MPQARILSSSRSAQRASGLPSASSASTANREPPETLKHLVVVDSGERLGAATRLIVGPPVDLASTNQVCVLLGGLGRPPPVVVVLGRGHLLVSQLGAHPARVYKRRVQDATPWSTKHDARS